MPCQGLYLSVPSCIIRNNSNCKQPKYPLIVEQINEFWYIHAIELSIRKKLSINTCRNLSEYKKFAK